MYYIVTGGYHGSGLRALMIASRLCYIAIHEHVLPSVHYSDVNMNICISMEETMFESLNQYWLKAIE